jgi:hypothetical protein
MLFFQKLTHTFATKKAPNITLHPNRPLKGLKQPNSAVSYLNSRYKGKIALKKKKRYKRQIPPPPPGQLFYYA